MNTKFFMTVLTFLLAVCLMSCAPSQKVRISPTAGMDAAQADQHWGKFRAKWIDLEGDAYKRFVRKNAPTFLVAPQSIKDEAVAKWQKSFGQTPWPVDYAANREISGMDNAGNAIAEGVKTAAEAIVENPHVLIAPLLYPLPTDK